MSGGDRVRVDGSQHVSLSFAASLFGMVFLLNAWFYNGYGWNQTARMDPIWAFVESGPNQYTLRIDEFLTDPESGINTGDWAHNPEHSPHYYSNKAPGVTLLGIPIYFLIYHSERLSGIDPTSVQSVLVNSYLINLWVTVLPVALSALFFFTTLRYLGRAPPESLWLTLLLYAGTLMLPFSTMTWAHTTAAAFVVMSLACFLFGGARRSFFAGLLAGAAVLTDYGAAPFALSIVVAAGVMPGRRADVSRIVLGGLGPLLVFLGYHWALFGSPFRLASSYSMESMLGEGDVLGMFGVLRWKALWGLTFSSVRGVFFFMPVLLLGLMAARRLADESHRAFVWLAFANIVSVLLVNMSYNTWQGGVSAGARYQIIALPFYVALIAVLADRRWLRPALIGLGAVSVANMVVLAAVSPMAPDAFRGSPLLFSWVKLIGVLQIDMGLTHASLQVPPLAGGSLSRGSLHIYPTFLMRDWTIQLNDPVIARFASFNLGERLFGLRGVWSLLPLGVLTGVLVRVALGCADAQHGEHEA